MVVVAGVEGSEEPPVANEGDVMLDAVGWDAETIVSVNFSRCKSNSGDKRSRLQTE